MADVLPVIRERFIDLTETPPSQVSEPVEVGYGPPSQVSGNTPAALAADPAPPPPADPPAETDEQKSAREAAEAAQKAADAEKDKTPAWLKAEVTKERNRRRASEERQAQLEDQLRQTLALANRYMPDPNAAKPEPKREEFSDPDAYIEARAEWRAEQISAARIADQSRRAQEGEAQRLQREHMDRMTAAEDKYPGITDVARDPTLPVNEAMGAAIVTSDHGPDILHYLDEHRDEAKRIYSLQPARAAAEIGKIEEKITAPKPAANKVSAAPKPITPVGGNGGVVKGKYDPGITDAEYFAIVEQEQKAKLAQLRGNGAAR